MCCTATLATRPAWQHHKHMPENNTKILWGWEVQELVIRDNMGEKEIVQALHQQHEVTVSFPRPLPSRDSGPHVAMTRHLGGKVEVGVGWAGAGWSGS